MPPCYALPEVPTPKQLAVPGYLIPALSKTLHEVMSSGFTSRMISSSIAAPSRSLGRKRLP